MTTIVPVILSGGAGTRLWPLSRDRYPKQFLPLIQGECLFARTVRRAAVSGAHPPVVVANDDHRFLVAEQLRQIGAGGTILLEPVARNTAVAVAAAAVWVRDHAPDAVMAVLPSDHLIEDEGAWRRALAAAVGAAEGGRIVAFGVVPDRPETGFGYILRAAGADPGARSWPIEKFVEKPDRRTAQRFVADGRYLWNAGMFVFRPPLFLGELERYEPEIASAAATAVARSSVDLDFVRLDQCALEQAPSKPVDVAVMERTPLGSVVPVECGWSDVGSWTALHDATDCDADGNAVIGDVVCDGTRDSYLRGEGIVVAALGVKDLVVIGTPDAVLVADRARAQDVRLLVDRLKAARRDEAIRPRVQHRPWGIARILHEEDGYRVNHLEVAPGRRMRLQRHAQRTEYWIVLAGEGQATIGRRSQALAPGDAVSVQPGLPHRIENTGSAPLHMVEVQLGRYLDEDDVERLAEEAATS